MKGRMNHARVDVLIVFCISEKKKKVDLQRGQSSQCGWLAAYSFAALF